MTEMTELNVTIGTGIYVWTTPPVFGTYQKPYARAVYTENGIMQIRNNEDKTPLYFPTLAEWEKTLPADTFLSVWDSYISKQSKYYKKGTLTLKYKNT
jgi:hypothetical protein